MYTLHMSRSFRALVLSFGFVWALVPQLACFMPGAMLADEPERECCKQMANDCGKTNMTHECCRTVVPGGEGVAVKTVRHTAPQLEVIETSAILGSAPLAGARHEFIQNIHAPPHDPGASFLILRI